jgi:hypothetical protein
MSEFWKGFWSVLNSEGCGKAFAISCVTATFFGLVFFAAWLIPALDEAWQNRRRK